MARFYIMVRNLPIWKAVLDLERTFVSIYSVERETREDLAIPCIATQMHINGTTQFKLFIPVPSGASQSSSIPVVPFLQPQRYSGIECDVWLIEPSRVVSTAKYGKDTRIPARPHRTAMAPRRRGMCTLQRFWIHQFKNYYPLKWNCSDQQTISKYNYAKRITIRELRNKDSEYN